MLLARRVTRHLREVMVISLLVYVVAMCLSSFATSVSDNTFGDGKKLIIRNYPIDDDVGCRTYFSTRNCMWYCWWNHLHPYYDLGTPLSRTIHQSESPI